MSRSVSRPRLAGPAVVEALADSPVVLIRLELSCAGRALRLDNPVFATVIPSKIFESMGMGVPILMSLPEGEATGIIRRTGSGVCVPPEDPAAMADAVRALADDPARMQTLRRTAREAAPQFSRDALAHDMLRVLEAVARQR